MKQNFSIIKSHFENSNCDESLLRGASSSLEYQLLANHYLSRFIPFFPNLPTLKILDIGCGDGKITNLFSKYLNKDSSILAIDFSAHLINTAKKYYSNSKIEYDCVNVLELNIDEKFDIIYSYAVLQYFSIEQFHELSILLNKFKNTNGIICHMSIPNKEHLLKYYLNRNIRDLAKLLYLIPKYFLKYKRSIFSYGENGLWHDKNDLIRSSAAENKLIFTSDSWYRFDLIEY